jgi:hypothetical protein
VRDVVAPGLDGRDGIDVKGCPLRWGSIDHAPLDVLKFTLPMPSAMRPQQTVGSGADRGVQVDGHVVQVGIEQVGVYVERHTGFRVPEHPLHRVDVGSSALDRLQAEISKSGDTGSPLRDTQSSHHHCPRRRSGSVLMRQRRGSIMLATERHHRRSTARELTC